MNKALLNVVLRVSEETASRLQDEAEEFRFDFDELVSLTVEAAVRGLVERGQTECLYERIDWAAMKEQGLCE